MQQLKEKYPKYFYNQDWYESEDFFTKEVTREGMWVISKKTLPESLNKTYQEQTDILHGFSGNRRTAVEIMYDIITYKEKTGEFLLSDKYEYSMSRCSGGELVLVGFFFSDGALVSSYRPGHSHDYLGVSFSKSL